MPISGIGKKKSDLNSIKSMQLQLLEFLQDAQNIYGVKVRMFKKNDARKSGCPHIKERN